MSYAEQLRRQLDTMGDTALLGVVAVALGVASRRGLYGQQDHALLRSMVAATTAATTRANTPAPAPRDDAQLDLDLDA